MTASLSLPAPHVGVHHLANDGSGPDDGDLHNQVVKTLRTIAWQRSHLRAAFNLEHAHGIGLLQGAIDFLILRQLCQIGALTIVLRESAQYNL